MTQAIECNLCPHHCKIKEGGTGICQTRTLINGQIVSRTYGEVAALHLDPIEKKPFYHFYPGTSILSVGGFGCNLNCFFCQNHDISQQYQKGQRVTPEQLAEMAQHNQSLGICFTYSEPLIWFEMVAETASLVKKQGGKVVLVSNGIIEEKYLDSLIPLLDAVNIDIKAFNEEFYRRYTGGKLEWVLNTVERMARRVHLEITTLVIPTLNDSPSEIKALAQWLSNLNTPLAWHLSRYFPRYKSNIPTTDENKLKKLWELAKEYLPYVYLGNMRGGDKTYCPQCGAEVISRDYVIKVKTRAGKCPVCGYEIWGLGLQ